MSNDIPPWQRDLMGKLLSSGGAGIPYAIAQPNPFLPVVNQPQPTVANPFRPAVLGATLLDALEGQALELLEAANRKAQDYNEVASALGVVRRDPVPSEGKTFSIDDLMKLTNVRWTLRGDSLTAVVPPSPDLSIPYVTWLPPDPAPQLRRRPLPPDPAPQPEGRFQNLDW